MTASRAPATARALARCRRGIAAIEFALIAPVLILCLVGIMEAGRAIWLYNDIQNTASRLARWAYLNIGAEDITSEAGRSAMLAALGAQISGGGYAIGIPADEISLAGTTFTTSSFGCSVGGGAGPSDARVAIVLRWRFRAVIEEMVPWDFDIENQALTPLQCNPGA